MFKIIVVGFLNTDIVASGITEFPNPGEHVYAKNLQIGPGGKSRNLAQMVGVLSKNDSVVMLGKTVKDPYGLWKPPVDSLKQAGVNTEHIIIERFEDVQKMPGIALIPVNTKGENQIIVAPGISDDFTVEDLESSKDLFEKVADNDGYLALTMECSVPVFQKAIEIASQLNIKIILDPGGIQKGDNFAELLSHPLFLLKPNEHEAKIITGIEVVDLESATLAAKKIESKFSVQNVIITHGDKGAYLFEEGKEPAHVIPQRIDKSAVVDTTGCGDQTMATFIAELIEGESLVEATQKAVISGTLQCQRIGIVPVEKRDFEETSFV